MMYQPDEKDIKTQLGGVVEDVFYVSGSWESLMQGYGEKEWTKSKMIPISSFIADFDPNYISYKTFE